MRRSISIPIAILTVVMQTAIAEVRTEQVSDPFDESGQMTIFVIEGAISEGDADRLLHELEGYEVPAYFTPFRLASPGGDVVEAIRLGGVLRRVKARVVVTEDGCFSSCALILAGADMRVINGPIGIHRPYFAELMSDGSIEDAYKKSVSMVSEYLREMNISDGLADLMFSVPPEETRILSKQEVEMYFPEEDPVAEAKRINKEAAKFDLTPATYRKRLAYAQAHCDEKYANCRAAIIWGVSQQVYDEWWQECLEWVNAEAEKSGNSRGPYNCHDAVPPPWLK